MRKHWAASQQAPPSGKLRRLLTRCPLLAIHPHPQDLPDIFVTLQIEQLQLQGAELALPVPAAVTACPAGANSQGSPLASTPFPETFQQATHGGEPPEAAADVHLDSASQVCF
jgi:hypothetical protein